LIRLANYGRYYNIITYIHKCARNMYMSVHLKYTMYISCLL